MIKKTLALLAVTAMSCSLFANVDLRTNIRDIFYRGTCEEAGSITMSVNGDDFREASTVQPVFIRVRLDQGATLCQTLVNNHNSAANPQTFNVPIYLAMRVESTLGGSLVNIAAPANTVSIVRWKRGETDIWLRVSTPTTQWLSFQGVAGTRAPDNTTRVAWTFGTTARNSQSTNDADFLSGLANLPFNTRNWALFSGPGFPATYNGRAVYAQSTLICVDVSNAPFLEPSPAPNSILAFDTISFNWNAAIDPEPTTNPNAEEFDGNVRTASSPAGLIPGIQTSANFSGDDSIARGFDLACSIATSKLGQVNTSLCFDEEVVNQQGDTTFGLVCTSGNTIRITILGCYGWNTGSQIALETEAGADYGFRVYKDASGRVVRNGNFVLLNPIYFSLSELGGSGLGINAWAPISSTFTAAGEANALAAVAIITYTDLPSISTPDPTLLLGVTVCIDPTSPPQDIVIEGTVSVTNKDTANDVAPYDGNGDSDFSFDIVNSAGTGTYNMPASDQYQFCPPNATTIGTFTWEYGAFTECVNFTRIFYPYLPTIAGNNVFWSGISFVNQGASELDSLFGFIYEADGSPWLTTFPTLQVRQQQTWLLQDGADGVGFYDPDGVAPTRTLTPLGNDINPLNQRSSMFVVGQAEGQTNRDVALPDLDGFCLIGNLATGVTYGYLPRNTEYAERVIAPWQDGDLPPQFAKRAVAREGKPVFKGIAKEYLGQMIRREHSPFRK